MRTAEKSENRTQTKTIISEITKMLLFFAAGFLLARTVAAEKFSPFSLSLCAASPGAYIIPAALGAALGTVTMSGSVSAATYLIAAVLAAASRLIADKIMGKTTAVSASAIGFCSLLAARTAVMIYTGFEAVPYVLYAFEAIFAAAVAYFFFLAFEAAKSELTLSLYSQKQTTAVLISVSVLLCALSSVTVFGVSVARTVAAAVIICAARYGGESNGAISGTAFGIAMSVTNPDYLFLCGGYGFGGLMAGAFSRLGSAFAAGAFAVSNGIFALLCEDTDTALITLYEVMFSCVLFLMLPKGV
ncbi:MAG: hypothetical protein ACI4QV_02460, partial [Acutalibacteraceae bacterium]